MGTDGTESDLPDGAAARDRLAADPPVVEILERVANQPDPHVVGFVARLADDWGPACQLPGCRCREPFVLLVAAEAGLPLVADVVGGVAAARDICLPTSAVLDAFCVLDDPPSHFLATRVVIVR